MTWGRCGGSWRRHGPASSRQVSWCRRNNFAAGRGLALGPEACSNSHGRGGLYALGGFTRAVPAVQARASVRAQGAELEGLRQDYEARKRCLKEAAGAALGWGAWDSWVCWVCWAEAGL